MFALTNGRKDANVLLQTLEIPKKVVSWVLTGDDTTDMDQTYIFPSMLTSRN